MVGSLGSESFKVRIFFTEGQFKLSLKILSFVALFEAKLGYGIIARQVNICSIEMTPSDKLKSFPFSFFFFSSVFGLLGWA
jgi:hypothetical protein